MQQPRRSLVICDVLVRYYSLCRVFCDRVVPTAVMLHAAAGDGAVVILTPFIRARNEGGKKKHPIVAPTPPSPFSPPSGFLTCYAAVLPGCVAFELILLLPRFQLPGRREVYCICSYSVISGLVFPSFAFGHSWDMSD